MKKVISFLVILMFLVGFTNLGFSDLNKGDIQKIAPNLKQGSEQENTKETQEKIESKQELSLFECNNKATQLIAEKQYKEAIGYFEKYIKITEDVPLIYYRIGVCYSAMEEREKALEWIEKAFKKGVLGFREYRDKIVNNIFVKVNNSKDSVFKELIEKYYEKPLKEGEKHENFILKMFEPPSPPPLCAFNYLIVCAKTKEAAVIDVSSDEMAKDILSYVNENKLNLKYILITHNHGDHVAGLNELTKNTKAQVYAFSDMKNDDMIKVGNLSLRIISVPVHSKDSICFFLENENRIFAGDALNIFRTPPNRIIPFLNKYFSMLKDNTMVYTGHEGYLTLMNLKVICGIDKK